MDAAATVAQAHTAFGRDALTAEQSAVDQMTTRKADLDRYNAYVTQANSAIDMSTEVAGVKAHQDNVAAEMEKFMPTAKALTSKEQNDAKALVLKLRSGKGQPLQGVSSLVGGSASNEILVNGGVGSGPRPSGMASEAHQATRDAYEKTNEANTATQAARSGDTKAVKINAADAHKTAAMYHEYAAKMHDESGNKGAGDLHREQADQHHELERVYNSAAMAAANEGTSEGASKGWESRRSGIAVAAGKSDDTAHAATVKAWRSSTPEDHESAQKAHLDSAVAQRAAAKAHPQFDHFHETQAKGHEATAEYHKVKASEARDLHRYAATYGKNPFGKNSELGKSRESDKGKHPMEMADEAQANAANIAALEAVIANEGQVIEFPNEFKVEKANESDPGSNWVMISPYGDWPHPGGLQRFRKEDANEIVKDFNGIVPKAMRMGGMGIPFYIGHPDHPDFKTRYTDTKAYGRIKELQARDDGLWGNVKWSSQGKNMVNEEMFHGHSVNWRVRKDKDSNWRPYSIKSVGFTNEPNIAVPPITHANETDPDIENDLQRMAA
jgi:hypothetical protein